MSRRIGLGVFVGGCVALLGLPAIASAGTKVVYAGPPPVSNQIAGKVLAASKIAPKSFVNRYQPDINDFFLHRVTINAGDTVSFRLDGFHTVDLPGPTGTDVPLIVPGPTVHGVKDAAGSPFWFDGKVPGLGLNPALFAPSAATTYDGTARVDSGLPLGPPKPFNVQFTKPGVYKFFCDVHYGMVGYVVVKPTGQPIPTATQDTAALAKQVTGDVKTAVEISTHKPPAHTVDLGQSATDGVELYAMFPSTLTVKAGTPITFSMSSHTRDTHTASFGPKPYLKSLAKSFNSPVFSPIATYPSSPGSIVLTPASHGNGFANTGVLDRDVGTPLPASRQIDFKTPGVYHFQCLIHPFMHGTIIVKARSLGVTGPPRVTG